MKDRQTNGSGEMGKNAEKSFVSCMKANGRKIKPSTREQDIFEHWDFLLNDEHRIEVKGRKRLHRHATSVSDDIIYVEFRNVRGDNGWIYGKADFIALERPDGFLIVQRIALMRMAETLVQNQWSTRPTLYKKYRRHDRPDECVTVLSINDVLSLPHKLFRYQP